MSRFLNLNVFSSEEVKVRFMVVIPDMLKNAPMFKRLDAKIKGYDSALGVGRGRGVAMSARAQAAGRGAPLARR